ncbi:MAG TPA: HAMP domain-containing sensor histidine kinase [Polyangia bacterium]|nr:HAMP domain-containing sensor histidine kinase [Polyangia bacterium]
MTAATRPLVIAFGAVVFAFSSATAYSAFHASTISRAALSIAHEAAPGIQLLAEGRAGIREFQLLAGRYARGGSDRPRPRELEETWKRFDRELWSYLALEPSTAESANLRRSLTELNQKIWRLLQVIGPGDGDGAEVASLVADLGPTADATARISLRALETTAHRSEELALRIDGTYHGSMLIAFSLDVVSILLSAIAAWLLHRSLRRQAELVEANERLNAARADELEQFAGRVAHDILGPLTTVTFAVDAVERSIHDEHDARLLTRGRSSAMRVKEIVQALLDFARSGASPEPRGPADVRAVVDGVVDELSLEAQSCKAELCVEPFAPCAVACASGILTSMLSNLARNALKYLGNSIERRVSIRVLARDTRVCIEVQDSGPGVPAGTESEIFKPYVRLPGSTRQGLGLGLAIVKRFADAHGGSAGVRAAPSRGSVFWFELPAPIQPSPERSPSPAAPP